MDPHARRRRGLGRGRRCFHLEGFSTVATPTRDEWLVLGGSGDGSDQAARGSGEWQQRGDDDRRGDGDEVWKQCAMVLV